MQIPCGSAVQIQQLKPKIREVAENFFGDSYLNAIRQLGLDSSNGSLWFTEQSGTLVVASSRERGDFQCVTNYGDVFIIAGEKKGPNYPNNREGTFFMYPCEPIAGNFYPFPRLELPYKDDDEKFQTRTDMLGETEKLKKIITSNDWNCVDGLEVLTDGFKVVSPVRQWYFKTNYGCCPVEDLERFGEAQKDALFYAASNGFTPLTKLEIEVIIGRNARHLIDSMFFKGMGHYQHPLLTEIVKNGPMIIPRA